MQTVEVSHSVRMNLILYTTSKGKSSGVELGLRGTHRIETTLPVLLPKLCSRIFHTKFRERQRLVIILKNYFILEDILF
jgi:hypothetical protein